MSTDEPRYTTAEAAEKIGISADRLAAWARDGRIEAYDVGPPKGGRATYEFDRATIEELVEKRNTPIGATNDVSLDSI